MSHILSDFWTFTCPSNYQFSSTWLIDFFYPKFCCILWNRKSYSTIRLLSSWIFPSLELFHTPKLMGTPWPCHYLKIKAIPFQRINLSIPLSPRNFISSLFFQLISSLHHSLISRSLYLLFCLYLHSSVFTPFLSQVS